uniref:Uncharacterized protein n=1 Tax=Helianthus annuus TaxID=4232 RepID=A0A251TGX3_HELAN
MEGRSTLRPADLLVFDWAGGKHACVDFTGVSPLAGLRENGFVAGQAIRKAESKKVDKHAKACTDNQHAFVPFAFDNFGSLAPEAIRLLTRVQKEEIATDIYMQGLIVVDRPTLLRFCKMVAGAGTWEHDKAKESMLMAHCRGTMISTSITARGHNREWCTSIDVFFFYCLLYRRSCALAHGLAQYFTSAHHWQERRILHGGTYVTVIAHSLGHLTEVDPQLLPPIAPTRMSFQTLRGMKLNKRFDVLGERFKTRGVLIWVPRDLPEQFDLVYHPPDVAAIVQDPLMDLDGPAMPSHHHLPGRPSFHDTLFQVMPRELQQIRIYEPTLTGLWIWWVG